MWPVILGLGALGGYLWWKQEQGAAKPAPRAPVAGGTVPRPIVQPGIPSAAQQAASNAAAASAAAANAAASLRGVAPPNATTVPGDSLRGVAPPNATAPVSPPQGDVIVGPIVVGPGQAPLPTPPYVPLPPPAPPPPGTSQQVTPPDQALVESLAQNAAQDTMQLIAQETAPADTSNATSSNGNGLLNPADSGDNEPLV